MDEEEFSLTVAATGMAVWAGYSLLAAADVVLSALPSTWELARLAARLDEAYGGAGSAAALFPEEALERLSDDDVDGFEEEWRQPPSRFLYDELFADVRPTVFLFDEPERHLHPFAQDDAAAAITEFGRRGITCLLATHALPFLDPPTELSSFIRVTRGADGWTQAVPITDDLLRELDLAADSSEVSRAQLIHLTRAVHC